MKVRDSVRAAVDEAQFAKVLSTILRSGDAIPLLLSLPPTSIRPFKNFVNMAFALRRRPVYGSLVKITLKPVSNNGNEYSVASFTKVRDFAGEELAGIVAYAENFRKMVKETLEQRYLESTCAAASCPYFDQGYPRKNLSRRISPK